MSGQDQDNTTQLAEGTKTFLDIVRGATNIGAKLFRDPVGALFDEGGLALACRVSAALQTLEKVIDDRRSALRDAIIDRLRDADELDIAVKRVSEKTVRLDIPDLEVRLTLAGGNEKINEDAVRDLVERHDLDADRVFDDVEREFDVERAIGALREEGWSDAEIDDLFKETPTDPDADVLEALAAAGLVDDGEIDDCFYTTAVQERLRCTFEDSVKGYLTEAIHNGTSKIPGDK